MSIGPFGFTASSIAQLGQQASMYIPDDFLGMPHTVAIIQVVSLLVSLWLWGLAFWFFIVSVGSLWKYVRVGSHLPFQMTWWSFVFPNTALVRLHLRLLPHERVIVLTPLVNRSLLQG